MTLCSFLDAAEALLVEEYRRLGTNLMDALKETSPWSSAGRQDDTQQIAPTTSADVATAAQNDQALQMLQMMMAGATKA